MKKVDSKQLVLNYFNSIESKLGYRVLLKGNRHFGYYPRNSKKLSFSEAQRLMQDKLTQKLSLPSGSLLLDAGCGEGNTAVYLAEKHHYKVTGIDLINRFVDIAREKAKKLGVANLTKFEVGDYSEIETPKDYFDGIYTMETLVHVKKYKTALKNFFKALKHGGRLVLFEYTIEEQSKLNFYRKELWDTIIKGSGMMALPSLVHGTFPKILKEAGFVEIKVEDATERTLPMLKTFHNIAAIPYYVLRLLRQERRFVNILFSVEGYSDVLKNKTWRYVIISAKKP